MGNITAKQIKEIAASCGIDAIAITSAEPFEDIQVILEERKDKGYAADMQFTYRNPYRATHLDQTIKDPKSLIVCMVSYAQQTQQTPGDPYAVVAQYTTSNAREILDNGLKEIVTHLKSNHLKAVALSDDNALVDKPAAMRAGLGFFGKNSLIINRQWGSTVLIGSVVTNAELPYDDNVTLEEGIKGCGTCTSCIPACPTDAIISPGVIDSRKCLSWIAQSPKDISLEHRTAMGNKIYGCDDCQDACPYNKIQFRRTKQKPIADRYLEVKHLLQCSDEELLEIAELWYVYKRDPRYIRRNALIIAGNTLDSEDHNAWDLVKQWSDGDDEMLAEYASWALAQRTYPRWVE